jgi:hypothetical protein
MELVLVLKTSMEMTQLHGKPRDGLCVETCLNNRVISTHHFYSMSARKFQGRVQGLQVIQVKTTTHELLFIASRSQI